MELLLGLTDLGAVSRSQTMCLWKKASSKKKKKNSPYPLQLAPCHFGVRRQPIMSHLSHLCGAVAKHIWQDACRLRRLSYSAPVSLPPRAELLSLISACLIFGPSVLSVSFSEQRLVSVTVDWLRVWESWPNEALPKSAGSRHARERNLNTCATRQAGKASVWPTVCHCFVAICFWQCVCVCVCVWQRERERETVVARARTKHSATRTWVWRSDWWSTRWRLFSQYFCFTAFCLFVGVAVHQHHADADRNMSFMLSIKDCRSSKGISCSRDDLGLVFPVNLCNDSSAVLSFISLSAGCLFFRSAGWTKWDIYRCHFAL